MTDAVIKSIHESIQWLDDHKTSNNVKALVKVIDNLTIKAVTLGTLVTDSYALMNEAEDDYKISVAKFVDDYDGSAAKAERAAEVKYASKKKHWTGAKNTYKKLDMLLDRIDKICDSHRQRVSVLKGEIKHV